MIEIRLSVALEGGGKNIFMIIKEITAKNIITKSNIPAVDYVINPYIGCNHSCIYCYARFMKRFTGHAEKWGDFIDVKMNAADLIPSHSTKYRGKFFFLSSVTDPYLPLEKKYELTRRILKKLIPLQPHLGVQTKSNMVLRDIDLLKQFRECEVGLTITTLDDNFRKIIEPATAAIPKRIEALQKLKDFGIKTYVFIGPLWPFLTDWRAIIKATEQYADGYMFENLNLHGSITNDVKKILREKFAHLVDEYTDIYSHSSSYWTDVEQEIMQFCRREGVNYKIFFHHRAKNKQKDTLRNY